MKYFSHGWIDTNRLCIYYELRQLHLNLYHLHKPVTNVKTLFEQTMTDQV